MTTKKRVMNANLYDALEMCAMVFKGIETAVDDILNPNPNKQSNAPGCAYMGMGSYLAGDRDSDLSLFDIDKRREAERIEIEKLFLEVDIAPQESDKAVRKVLHREGKRDNGYQRVPFSDWQEELNLFRGSQEDANDWPIVWADPSFVPDFSNA